MMYEWKVYFESWDDLLNINTTCIVVHPKRTEAIAFILNRRIPHELYVHLVNVANNYTKTNGDRNYRQYTAGVLSRITREYFKAKQVTIMLYPVIV